MFWGKSAIEAKIFLCRQHEAWMWIEAVLNKKLTSPDLKESLHDGVVLLEVAQAIRGKLGKNKAILAPTRSSEKKRNIKLFINWCGSLNIPEERRFKVDDLYQAQNMVAVVNTLHVVASLARRRGFEPTLLKVTPEEMKFPDYELAAAQRHLEALAEVQEGRAPPHAARMERPADRTPSPSPSPARAPAATPPRRVEAASPAAPAARGPPDEGKQARPSGDAGVSKAAPAPAASPAQAGAKSADGTQAAAAAERKPAEEADPHPLSDSEEGGAAAAGTTAAAAAAVATGGEERPLKARATFDYTADKDNQLSFKKGDVMVIYDTTSTAGWWSAELGGNYGYVPYNYVTVVGELEGGSSIKVKKAGSGGKIAELQKELRKQGLHSKEAGAGAGQNGKAKDGKVKEPAESAPQLLTGPTRSRPQVNRRPPTRQARK